MKIKIFTFALFEYDSQANKNVLPNTQIVFWFWVEFDKISTAVISCSFFSLLVQLMSHTSHSISRHASWSLVPGHLPGTRCLSVFSTTKDTWTSQITGNPALGTLLRCQHTWMFTTTLVSSCVQCHIHHSPRTAVHCLVLPCIAAHFCVLPHKAVHCRTLLHIVAHCCSLPRISAHCRASL